MKNIVLIGIACMVYVVAQAQDRHYSQFYASPLTLNPALAGAYNAKYRIGAIYRNQWLGALDQPYTTYGAELDVRFNMPYRTRSKDAAAAGIYFAKDNVRGIDFVTNQMALSLAYHKALDIHSTQYLSLGVQGSLNQRNINYETLRFQDQFNGINGYTLVTRENLPENNFAFGDLNVGLNYTFSPKKGTQFFLGGTYHHIFQPQMSFYLKDERFKDTDIEGNRLLAKYGLHASAIIPMGEMLSLSPRVLASVQGPHAQLIAGNNFRFYFTNGAKTAFTAGGWARLARSKEGIVMDAIVGLVGVEVANFLIGVSYDAYISNVQTFRNGSGAFELTVQYLGDFEDEDGVLCPTF